MANFQTIRAKRGQNKFFFGEPWCFVGILGDRKGRKVKIYLKGVANKWGSWSALVRSEVCPLGRAVGAALAILLMLAKMDKIPSLRPFAAFALGALHLNMALFGF